MDRFSDGTPSHGYTLGRRAQFLPLKWKKGRAKKSTEKWTIQMVQIAHGA